jgi:hypothetical protein
MTREEFIKQRCEIDKITEEEFERTYRVVECNCEKIYCKGYRCLDLDGLFQELKKQLEATKKVAEENLKRWVIMKNQQKEFINYLEDKKISPVKCVLNSIGDKNQDYNMFKNKLNTSKEILQKYKEIIGENDV